MRHVNPIDARKGQFLESFPVRQFQEMLNYCFGVEMALMRYHITDKEVVYTRIGKGTGIRKWDTWQAFLVEIK